MKLIIKNNKFYPIYKRCMKKKRDTYMISHFWSHRRPSSFSAELPSLEEFAGTGALCSFQRLLGIVLKSDQIKY